MKKQRFAIYIFFINGLALAAPNLTANDISNLLPNCSWLKPKENTHLNLLSTYTYRCDKDESFAVSQNITNCALSDTMEHVVNCLYLSNNQTKPIKIEVTCQGASWVNSANQWSCTVAAPPIPGCKYSNDNILTGFYEYDCAANTKITGTSANGKCQSGSLDLYKTAYYCLAAEASSDIRVMLKCHAGWNPDPKNPGGFVCSDKP